MATPIRKPGSSDWGDTSYWSTGANPADTDDCKLLSGGDTITVNLSQPGINLNLLQFGPESRYNIGPSPGGSPLVIDANNAGAGKIEIYSAGDYINLQAGTDSGTWPALYHNPTNPAHQLYLFTAIVTLLTQSGGMLFLASSVTGTTLNVTGGYTHVQYTNSNGWQNINVYAGEVLLQRDFSGTCSIYGGKVVLDDDDKGITYGAVQLLGPTAVLDHRSGNTGAVTHNAGLWDKSSLRTNPTVGAVTGTAAAKIRPSIRGFDVSASSTSYPGGGPQYDTGGASAI